MKRIYNFWIMILGIFILGLTSCQKDDSGPDANYIIGESLDKSIVAYAEQLAYELKEGYTRDTIWAIDSQGNQIIDPVTKKPLYNGITQTAVTAEGQFKKLTFKVDELHTGVKFEVTKYFNEHPIEKILVGFPGNTKIISRVTSDGKSYENVLLLLNDLSSLVITEPSITINEKISRIFSTGNTTLQNAAKDYFVEFATNLLGGTKAKAKLRDMPESEKINNLNLMVKK